MMDQLSNKELIDMYVSAKELGLAEVFMKMIIEEMNKRDITDFVVVTINNYYEKSHIQQ